MANNLNILANSDDRLTAGLLHTLAINVPTSSPNDPKAIPFLSALVRLIFVVWTEPFKVLLRKDFGKHAISKTRIVVGGIFYIIWAFVIFYNRAEIAKWTFDESRITETTLIAGAVFYILLCLGTLMFGLNECYKSKRKYQDYLEKHHGKENVEDDDFMKRMFRGKSIVFDNEGKDIETSRKTWSFNEPCCCFILSALLTYSVPPIGGPLFITSLSFWFNELYQVKNYAALAAEKKEQDELNKLHTKSEKGKGFTQID